MNLTVTFDIGTDIDKRAGAGAEPRRGRQPRLPEEVRRRGVTVRKRATDLLLVVLISSPDGTYDQVYISNYALLNVRDELLRIAGVGDVAIRVRANIPCASGSTPSACGHARHDRRGGGVGHCGRRTLQVAGGALGRAAALRTSAFQPNAAAEGAGSPTRRVRGHRPQDRAPTGASCCA